MHIRKALQRDSASLQKLLLQLGYSLTKQQINNRIRAFQKPYHSLLVMEDDKKAIAVIAFGCFEHLMLNGKCCIIDTVVVDNDYRGQGLGKQLINVAEQKAKLWGALRLQLASADHRKSSGTHKFYTDLGFSSNHELAYTCFHKDI